MTNLASPSFKPKLLAIGGLHVDDIAIPSNALQVGVSNPVNWQRRIGGVATNAARVASRATPTQLIAAVGGDPTATALINTLQDDELQLSPIAFPNENTGRYTVVLDETGELHIGLSDVTLAEKITMDSLAHLLASVAPAGLLFDANLSSETITGITSLFAQNTSARTIAMPVSPARSSRLINCSEQIDLLICNRAEAQVLANTTSQHHLVEGLNAAGFAQFIITDADKPATVFDDTGEHRVDAPKVESIQLAVNGAGDALAGATVASWLHGHCLVDALTKYGMPAAKQVLAGHWQAPQVN